MKYNSTRITILLALLFFIGYTLLVGTIYPETLRTMEANCWTDDYVLQFFRWPYFGAAIMAFCMTMCMAIIALALYFVKLKRLMPLSLIAAIASAFFYPPTAKFNWGRGHLFSDDMKSDEQIYTYQHLAYEKQWTKLEQRIAKDGEANSELGIRYMLLAESAQGTLAENLFYFPINQTEQFLFRGYRSDVSCTFNLQFYDNIGIWDECYHQAQEYAMCQRDFCLRSLCQMIDYSIRSSEWQVAEKLLCVLDEALFYHDFVSDRRAEIARLKKKTPVNPAPLRADNFVTGYVFQNELVHDLQQHIGDSTKIQEYIACCMLIRKKVDQFCAAVPCLPRYKGKNIITLPECFQQANEIVRTRGDALHDAPPGTYAYYFYNRPIPAQEDRYESASTN